MKKVWIIVFGLGYLGLSAQKKWSLKECVSYAVEHNLQVIQNQYTKENQEYNLKAAKKDYLPSVSGSITSGVSFGQGSLGAGSYRNDRFNLFCMLPFNIQNFHFVFLFFKIFKFFKF